MKTRLYLAELTLDMLRTPLLFLLAMFCSGIQAQDTLRLLNGRILIVEITDDSGANVFFDAEKKNGRIKNYEVYKMEVFSIHKVDGEESVLYVQDPDMGYDLSVEEMRYFMAGQQDARAGYKAWPSMIGGFAFGAGTVFYFEGGYAPFTTPFVYSLTMQIPYIKIKESSISDKKNTISDLYVEGYNRTARSKKLLSNFIATMAGVVVGSTIYELNQ